MQTIGPAKRYVFYGRGKRLSPLPKRYEEPNFYNFDHRRKIGFPVRKRSHSAKIACARRTRYNTGPLNVLAVEITENHKIMMRPRLVAGNWKMNGSRAQARVLVEGVCRGWIGTAEVTVAVCPPFVYLAEVAQRLEGTSIVLGAQNVSHLPGGAYTGEITCAMLQDYGCRYVIVGHSERRAYYGEDDALVAKKVLAAQASGLMPIFCVGETLAEREAGQAQAVVARQLAAVTQNSAGVSSWQPMVIAYEPVWAIGTGRTASPAQAQEMHAFIRAQMALHSAESAARMMILYGGSVKGNNAAELFAMPDIDGGLIGGASLDAVEFLTIARAAVRA